MEGYLVLLNKTFVAFVRFVSNIFPSNFKLNLLELALFIAQLSCSSFNLEIFTLTFARLCLRMSIWHRSSYCFMYRMICWSWASSCKSIPSLPSLPSWLRFKESKRALVLLPCFFSLERFATLRDDREAFFSDETRLLDFSS